MSRKAARRKNPISVDEVFSCIPLTEEEFQKGVNPGEHEEREVSMTAPEIAWFLIQIIKNHRKLEIQLRADHVNQSVALLVMRFSQPLAWKDRKKYSVVYVLHEPLKVSELLKNLDLIITSQTR